MHEFSLERIIFFCTSPISPNRFSSGPSLKCSQMHSPLYKRDGNWGEFTFAKTSRTIQGLFISFHFLLVDANLQFRFLTKASLGGQCLYKNKIRSSHIKINSQVNKKNEQMKKKRR